MKFKQGDKVRYVGELSPNLVGLEGEVIRQTSKTNIEVRWPIYHPGGVMPESIELVEPEASPEVYYVICRHRYESYTLEEATERAKLASMNGGTFDVVKRVVGYQTITTTEIKEA